jgi:hypothetical protein
MYFSLKNTLKKQTIMIWKATPVNERICSYYFKIRAEMSFSGIWLPITSPAYVMMLVVAYHTSSILALV